MFQPELREIIFGVILNIQTVLTVCMYVWIQLKDTEEKDDVRLSHKLRLTAAVDVTLKTHKY